MDVTPPRPAFTDEQRAKLLLFDIIRIAYFPADGRLIPLHIGGHGSVRWGSTYSSVDQIFNEFVLNGAPKFSELFFPTSILDKDHQATFKYEWL